MFKLNRWLTVIAALVMAPLFASGAGAAAIKDSESASHGADAADYEIVNTYTFPGFKVIQFNLAVLSHYSYLLASGKEALVIDPGREVKVYLETARKEGLQIKGVFLTHAHADFVAGHMELAKAAGCPIYVSAQGGAQHPHQPLKEGDTRRIGEATLGFIATPGHTPDGLCGAVYAPGQSGAPKLLFTGDTLLVGSIGRPDLLEGQLSAAALAAMSYDSWTTKLAKLPDETMILPAHGAGSLCGAHLSDEPKSTIGGEKAANPYLKYKTRNEYVAAVLDGLPEAPQYFKHNAALNKKGPELVEWSAPLSKEAAPNAELTDPAKIQVVDLREARDYAAGHIPKSVNIALRGRLETWVGTMIPWGANLVLCGAGETDLKEARRRLHRIGYQGGVITMERWKKAGQPVVSSALIKPADLYAQMQKGVAPVVVDVRLPSEWMGARIGTVINLPLSHLAELAGKLDPAQPTVTVCNSAYRSSMGVGILERRGFTRLASLDGGSEAWINAGLPMIQAMGPAAGRAVAPPDTRALALPERIDAASLKRMIMDLPGTFELIDIRPSEQFADYSIPGSRNVDIGEVMTNMAYLAGPAPLVLVDRDGSLAMAVGGILSQKTKRTIKVLHGGLEAYWMLSELRPAVSEVPLAGSGALPKPAMQPAAPLATQPAAPEAAPQAPRKKSAGC